MTEMTRGVIVTRLDEDRLRYLARELFWYGHDTYKGAWVHDESVIDEINTMILLGQWKGSVPEKIQPAEWNPETGVRTTGDPEDFPFNDEAFKNHKPSGFEP